MKRWLAIAVQKVVAGSALGLLGLGMLSGCQTTFLSQDVFEGAQMPLPAKLEQDPPCPIMQPITAMTKAPPTVTDADRPARYLSLQEAIAIALENGHASGRAGAGQGRVDNTLASIGAIGASMNSQSERVRILAFNPATANAAMEASLSRFDALFYQAMNWTNTDNLQQGLSTFNNGHGATYASGFLKPLAGGGVANVALLVNYQNLTTPPTGAFSTLNPQYTSRLIFGFEQPLLKDWGSINQLLPRLSPLSGLSLNPATSSAAQSVLNTRQSVLGSFVDRNTEGILISRLRSDQQRAEFERNIHVLLVQTEVAYWILYNKYGQLYSFEENLRIMHTAWQSTYYGKVAGAKEAFDNFYQVTGQFEEFRGERLRALNEVIEAERNLRGILGMPVEDGNRLVPITPPTIAEVKPHWETSLQDALNLRPELILARDNVRYHQYLVSIQKNNIRPDLRAHAKYEPVGFGSTLTGNETFLDGTGTERPSNSFRSLAKGSFADYSFGVTLTMPLGYRAELAAIRAARLELIQSYYFLRDQEEKATRYLHEQYSDVVHKYESIKAHRAERLAYGLSVEQKFKRIKADQKSFADPLFLEAQRRYASALVKEYGSIAEYNSALARLEWAKGTILNYNNVHISEGELPQCAQVRAVDNEKERSLLVLRQRPDSLHQPGRLCGTKDSVPTALEPMEVESATRPPVHVMPIEKSKFEPQTLPPRPLDEQAIPAPVVEIIPIDFRPKSAAEKSLNTIPRPLPRLEEAPAPAVIVPNTSAIPHALPPLPSMIEPGSKGLVTIN